MSLDRYASAALQAAEEMKFELLAEEYEMERPETLHTALENLIEHERMHRDAVHRVASETPAKRRKTLAKYDLKTRFWIHACAATFAYRACYGMLAVEQNLDPYGPYRKMIARYGEFLNDIRDTDAHEWLFPDTL